MGEALEKVLVDTLFPVHVTDDAARAHVRVLVVDDNDGDAELVSEYLSDIASLRFELQRASRLAQAIAMIAESPPDIVLLDLGLPDSQGPETLERLRESVLSIPLVVFTGHDDADVASAVLKAGAQDFLVKGSFDGDALFRTLRHAIERHRAQLEQIELVRCLAIANEQLERLANTDALTGVLNRRGLESALGELMKRSHRMPTRAIAMLIDCDDFKAVNERGGHATGDVVLAGVAQAIVGALRTIDFVGRVGGDEFLVILTEVGIWDAMRVAERVRRAVRFPRHLESVGIDSVTVSIGVAELKPGTVFLSEVLAATQAFLHTSKRTGKNKVVSSDDLEQPPSLDHDELVRRLTSADYLKTVSQPIVRLSDNTTVAHELLTRFGIPGLREPNDFFRVAQEADVLTAADLACIRAGLRVSGKFEPHPLHLNVFASTLLEIPTDDVLELFGDTLPRICLEISEKQTVPDPVALKRRLQPLREHGLRVAIDDVGFGRTSLEMLLFLEPEIVKLDRDFVEAATTAEDTSARRSIQRLMQCAECLGAAAIAEGIESEAQLELVKTFGISLGQGYLWGQPI